jgi:hypothetical protein
MTYRKCKLVVFSLALMLCSSMYGNAARAQSSSGFQYDPNRVPWTDLTFHAKNFWAEVSTSVELISLPAAEAEALLLPSPKGAPIKPAAPQVYQMTINTTIEPKFRSPVSIYNRIWFNPTDAAALGRIWLRRGEDDYKKIYRFTRQGVFRHQIEPKNMKEALLAPENWSNESDNFYAYDPAKLGCSGITERSLLIYMLSAADNISKTGNPLSLCVFDKRQLHRVKLQQEGTYPISVNFVEKAQQKEIRKEERIDALKIAINAKPMESDLNEVENFSFFGLHEDISIYIDPQTALPIQVSGIIPTVGSAHLKLVEVGLKQAFD